MWPASVAATVRRATASRAVASLDRARAADPLYYCRHCVTSAEPKGRRPISRRAAECSLVHPGHPAAALQPRLARGHNLIPAPTPFRAFGAEAPSGHACRPSPQTYGENSLVVSKNSSLLGGRVPCSLFSSTPGTCAPQTRNRTTTLCHVGRAF